MSHVLSNLFFSHQYKMPHLSHLVFLSFYAHLAHPSHYAALSVYSGVCSFSEFFSYILILAALDFSLEQGFPEEL